MKTPRIQLALASLLLLSGLARAACGPTPGGPPACAAGSSAASLGGSGGPAAGAGNPLNVITGNKYQREDDLPALPGVLGLEIVRHYNSAFSKPGERNGIIGRGWRLSYETDLLDFGGKIQVLQADGGRVIFSHDPKNPNLCGTALPANGSMALERDANGMVEYTWTWANGRKLHFNRRGKLDTITAPTGERVTLHYDSVNLLVRVVDPQGRSLNLAYLDSDLAKANDRFRGVQYIDSPVGRYAYEYGSALPKGAGPFDKRQLLANLVRVRLPTDYRPNRKAHELDGRGATVSRLSRFYHHENPAFPWLLTGISIEAADKDNKTVASRYATYGYDHNARANLSTHAGNVDKVTLDTSEGGKTTLTNSLGQKTVYRYAVIGGEHRMLEVRGAGCATCGDSNVRYGYDRLGQLTETTRLDDQGGPVTSERTERDQLGRVVKVSRVPYSNGKPGPAQWLLRMEYLDDGGAPAVIAQPSVVPGKERQTRIAYNITGQPVTVSDIGWIPTYDGKQAAAQIVRTTSYRYATINGRSLLTRIDGPLPNGKSNSPLDSDVTVFEYDNRPDTENEKKNTPTPAKLARYDERDQRNGLLTRIVAPGDLVTEVLERDEALRPAKLRMIDGGRVLSATAANNWRGLPDHIEFTAGSMHRQLHYSYNAEGKITAVTGPGNLRSSFEYDQAGHVSRVILPDGSGLAIAQDTEDRIASVAKYQEMAAATAEALSSTRFEYDRVAGQPGRLTGIADTLGRLKSYSYNDVGQVVAMANALGTKTTFGYDGDGRLELRTDAAGSANAATSRQTYDNAGQATSVTGPNGARILRRHDDFGRKVFEADPDRGVTLFRYDAAGRPLVRIDETRSATRYAYDHAGRLLAIGKDKLSDLLQYRYRGSQLVGMVSTTDGKPGHAAERLDYQYDAMGQLTRETRWFADVRLRDGGISTNAKGLRFITNYEYDDAGRMVVQTLPDGHSLRYRFAPADTVGRQPGARRRPGQLEAILFDDQVVVADIERTIAGGITGYTMSNGARQQVVLDRRGRIEQLRTLTGTTGPDAAWWQRIAAWFSANRDVNQKTLYRQRNRYDEADRLVQIERQLPASDGQASPMTRREGYAYDGMDRLNNIVSSEGRETYFRYDQAGNRIGESSQGSPGAAQPATGLKERGFSYAPGGNWLLSATQATDGAATPSVRSAWFYHSTGLPLAQLQWRSDAAATNRRTVYNSDKRPVAVYDNGRLVAQYHYNSLGERIAKTVYPARPALVPASLSKAAPQGETSYTLYHNQRLAAETDSQGRITAHYVYLYGKPVAKIEMGENPNFAHRVWKAITMRHQEEASDRLAHIYAIVTDHLGTPQEVLDRRQQAVWQAITAAFGQARVVRAMAGTDGKPFAMNLRLPGQVYDAETSLHYNYLRDYDPTLGRYLAPDPMGLAAGSNPYAYVSNNPLTNIDPLGLYQIDIHYYMTYFLAITAGVDKDVARQIALATQYIDDNKMTSPTPEGMTHAVIHKSGPSCAWPKNPFTFNELRPPL